MDPDAIMKGTQQIIDRFGPWTAHCIHLGDGVYTFGEPQINTRLRRFLQIASDITAEPLGKLRVLDLACLEGLFGIEFARHGANVLAIEGREANLAKAQFAKEVLSLSNLELTLGDVRTLDVEQHGHFDVVLCLGILYHLDTPDAMEFVQRIYSVCNRLTIIDTNFSLHDEEAYTWNGNTYWGKYAREHASGDASEQKLRKNWASLENPRSFLFTRASLCNLLRHVGFTSVYECLNPYEYHNPNWPRPALDERHVELRDRLTVVAIKGKRQRLISSPVTEASPELDRPERPEYLMVGPVPRPRTVRSIVGQFIPRRWKRALRAAMRRW
jgi:SAM-dependent methyltransferase